jgi:circadian clock protein KaiC
MSAPVQSDQNANGALETRGPIHLLPKSPTGIEGLDEVTGGGLPLGRPTLICGPAGCGKTLLAMEFLVNGITKYDEPAVFVAFEESADDLAANVASLGFDLPKYQADGKLVIEHLGVLDQSVEVTGDWTLDGLFIRLGAAIDEIGAKRVAIDTIENLFGAFKDQAVLRSEIRRLFAWLKDRKITAVITGERGDGTLTRNGIEEYVSDCVLVMDHRVSEQTSTRRMHILKYRGSIHGTNEYPFLIGSTGVTVVPITAQALNHQVLSKRVSSGIPRLDSMLGGGGYYQGSSILISGPAGTGKSTIAAQFCDATCQRGERALYFAFEEAQDEIVRNMASVGLDLQRWVDADLLRFQCFRPSLMGLEGHLFEMLETVAQFDPAAVVKDPISDLLRIGSPGDVAMLLTRQVDFLKNRGITALFTSLVDFAERRDDQHIASLIDTWLRVDTAEGNGENNRLLFIQKSRGMAHSNQIREFLLTSEGVELADVYVGPQGVLTGSARQAQEAKEARQVVLRGEELEQRRINLARRKASVEARTTALWQEFEDEAEVVERLLMSESSGVEEVVDQRLEQGRLRSADVFEETLSKGTPNGGKS